MSFNEESTFICDNDKFERVFIGRLRDDRESIQAKTYKNWINSVLIKARTSINDIYVDLCDGQKLLLLLELITGEKIAEPNKGSSVLHKIENVSHCLKFIKSKDVYLESIGPEDIVNGNKRLTLGLIWTIILRFQLSQHLDFVQFDLKTIKDSLLLWCQSKTSKSTNCRVRDFKRSWSDGWAFVELVRSFRPDLMDPEQMRKMKSVEVLDHAFDVANQHLMIPSILDAEDVANSVDENSILTYISYFYNLYCKTKTTDTGSKRIKFILTQVSEVQNVQSSYEQKVSELILWIREKCAHFERDIDINEAHEEMSKFNDYFWSERPARLKARNECESLYLDIVNMHKKMCLRAFVPKSGLTVKDLEKAWMHLEEVETSRQSKLKAQMTKYEQLTKVSDTFDLKCLKLENYISEKLGLLNQIFRGDHSTDFARLEVHLKQSELICCDIVSNSAKFDSIFKLADQLVEHRYKNYEFVQMCRSHLQAKLKKLTDMAVLNHRTIESTTKVITYMCQLDCLKTELDQLLSGLDVLPLNRTNSVQNVFVNLEKLKQCETELRLLDRQFLVVQSRICLITDNNNHNSRSILLEPSVLQQRLGSLRGLLEQCRDSLEKHITINHLNLDYNEFKEEIDFLQMFFHEKQILCQSSTDQCFDSTSMLYVQRRHNILKLEVKSVEKQFYETCQKGFRLMAQCEYYSPLVNEYIEQTKQQLRRTMHMANERTYLINDSATLLQLCDQMGQLDLPIANENFDDMKQTVFSLLQEQGDIARLDVVELNDILEKINRLCVNFEHMAEPTAHLVKLKQYSAQQCLVESRHAFLLLKIDQPLSFLRDIHCRLLRVVTDNFRAAQQLLAATEYDFDGDSLRRLLIEQNGAVEVATADLHRDGVHFITDNLSNGAGSLEDTERMVDLFLNRDNLSEFIGTLQERQTMFQSDMNSMTELMAFVRNTLQLLKVTQTFTRTFVQVKNDRQQSKQQRLQRTKSPMMLSADLHDDKNTPTSSTTSADYTSKLNPEAFKFKVVTYKLQKNLNFIDNYLGNNIGDDKVAALKFKLNFSSDILRKDMQQLHLLLKETEQNRNTNLELRQEVEKTSQLIDSVTHSEAVMDGKVKTLQRMEAVEGFAQVMADNVKLVEAMRTDADQVTVTRNVNKLRTVTVTLQSHFEQLINQTTTTTNSAMDQDDVKVYENRITSLKQRFVQFQNVLSQKSNQFKQRLDQLFSSEVQSSANISATLPASDLLPQTLIIPEAIQTIDNDAKTTERDESQEDKWLHDDLENALRNAEMVLFEIDSGDSVSQRKFDETMVSCDSALVNQLVVDDESQQQRINSLKTRLTRAWIKRTQQTELDQFNERASQFASTCSKVVQVLQTMQSTQMYDNMHIAIHKQKHVQLGLDYRTILEQFRRTKSAEISSRLVQLQDILNNYKRIINELEVMCEMMGQLGDIDARLGKLDNSTLTNYGQLDDLLKEIDAAMQMTNRASLSNNNRQVVTNRAMQLKKKCIELQMKDKLSALAKTMHRLGDTDQLSLYSALKNQIESILTLSETLDLNKCKDAGHVDELLLNWSLISDKVDRVAELMERESANAHLVAVETTGSQLNKQIITSFEHCQTVASQESIDQSSQTQYQLHSKSIISLTDASTNTDELHNLPISCQTSPQKESANLHMSDLNLQLNNTESTQSDDNQLATNEIPPPEQTSDIELAPEFDGKSSGRTGNRSSLESALSCDYLLSVKDYGSMQTFSDENFALSESTMSLYYSGSDSGHCELAFNSPENRSENNDKTTGHFQPAQAMGTSRQTISSSFTSLALNVTESSDELRESENESAQECSPTAEKYQPTVEQQIAVSCESAERRCGSLWSQVEATYEQISKVMNNESYSAYQNATTKGLFEEISKAIQHRRQLLKDKDGHKSIHLTDDSSTSMSIELSNALLNRIEHLQQVLTQSESQMKYLVDNELQYLSELSSKIDHNDRTDEFAEEFEVGDFATIKSAPLAEREDSFLPDEDQFDTKSLHSYKLAKSQPIDFRSTDIGSESCSSEAQDELNMSMESISDVDIEGDNLQFKDSIDPQLLVGLEEKVGGIKSELEDIAARIAKHNDGKRLSFEECQFNEQFEFAVINADDTSDGHEVATGKIDSIENDDKNAFMDTSELNSGNDDSTLDPIITEPDESIEAQENNLTNSSDVSTGEQLHSEQHAHIEINELTQLEYNQLKNESFDISIYDNTGEVTEMATNSNSQSGSSNSGDDEQSNELEDGFAAGNEKITSVADSEEWKDSNEDDTEQSEKCADQTTEWTSEPITSGENETAQIVIGPIEKDNTANDDIESNQTDSPQIDTYPNHEFNFITNSPFSATNGRDANESIKLQESEQVDEVQFDTVTEKSNFSLTKFSESKTLSNEQQQDDANADAANKFSQQFHNAESELIDISQTPELAHAANENIEYNEIISDLDAVDKPKLPLDEIETTENNDSSQCTNSNSAMQNVDEMSFISIGSEANVSTTSEHNQTSEVAGTEKCAAISDQFVVQCETNESNSESHDLSNVCTTGTYGNLENMAEIAIDTPSSSDNSNSHSDELLNASEHSIADNEQIIESSGSEEATDSDDKFDESTSQMVPIPVIELSLNNISESTDGQFSDNQQANSTEQNIDVFQLIEDDTATPNDAPEYNQSLRIATSHEHNSITESSSSATDGEGTNKPSSLNKNALPTNIEPQQSKQFDAAQLDCLEDRVYQIASQLDAIAERLAEYAESQTMNKFQISSENGANQLPPIETAAADFQMAPDGNIAMIQTAPENESIEMAQSTNEIAEFSESHIDSSCSQTKDVVDRKKLVMEKVDLQENDTKCTFNNEIKNNLTGTSEASTVLPLNAEQFLDDSIELTHSEFKSVATSNVCTIEVTDDNIEEKTDVNSQSGTDDFLNSSDDEFSIGNVTTTDQTGITINLIDNVNDKSGQNETLPKEQANSQRESYPIERSSIINFKPITNDLSSEAQESTSASEEDQFDSMHLDNLENRVFLIAAQLDAIADRLAENAESQTVLSQCQTNDFELASICNEANQRNQQLAPVEATEIELAKENIGINQTEMCESAEYSDAASDANGRQINIEMIHLEESEQPENEEATPWMSSENATQSTPLDACEIEPNDEAGTIALQEAQTNNDNSNRKERISDLPLDQIESVPLEAGSGKLVPSQPNADVNSENTSTACTTLESTHKNRGNNSVDPNDLPTKDCTGDQQLNEPVSIDFAENDPMTPIEIEEMMETVQKNEMSEVTEDGEKSNSNFVSAISTSEHLIDQCKSAHVEQKNIATPTSSSFQPDESDHQTIVLQENETAIDNNLCLLEPHNKSASEFGESVQTEQENAFSDNTKFNESHDFITNERPSPSSADINENTDLSNAVLLDSLDERVYQIATQLDAIAERLTECAESKINECQTTDKLHYLNSPIDDNSNAFETVPTIVSIDSINNDCLPEANNIAQVDHQICSTIVPSTEYHHNIAKQGDSSPNTTDSSVAPIIFAQTNASNMIENNSIADGYSPISAASDISATNAVQQSESPFDHECSRNEHDDEINSEIFDDLEGRVGLITLQLDDIAAKLALYFENDQAEKLVKENETIVPQSELISDPELQPEQSKLLRSDFTETNDNLEQNTELNFLQTNANNLSPNESPYNMQSSIDTIKVTTESKQLIEQISTSAIQSPLADSSISVAKNEICSEQPDDCVPQSVSLITEIPIDSVAGCVQNVDSHVVEFVEPSFTVESSFDKANDVSEQLVHNTIHSTCDVNTVNNSPAEQSTNTDPTEVNTESNSLPESDQPFNVDNEFDNSQIDSEVLDCLEGRVMQIEQHIENLLTKALDMYNECLSTENGQLEIILENSTSGSTSENLNLTDDISDDSATIAVFEGKFENLGKSQTENIGQQLLDSLVHDVTERAPVDSENDLEKSNQSTVGDGGDIDLCTADCLDNNLKRANHLSDVDTVEPIEMVTGNQLIDGTDVLVFGDSIDQTNANSGELIATKGDTQFDSHDNGSSLTEPQINYTDNEFSNASTDEPSHTNESCIEVEQFQVAENQSTKVNEIENDIECLDKNDLTSLDSQQLNDASITEQSRTHSPMSYAEAVKLHNDHSSASDQIDQIQTKSHLNAPNNLADSSHYSLIDQHSTSPTQQEGELIDNLKLSEAHLKKSQNNECLPEMIQPVCDINENASPLTSCIDQLPRHENDTELKWNDSNFQVTNNQTIDSQLVSPEFESNEVQTTFEQNENYINATNCNYSIKTAMDNVEGKIKAIEMQLGDIVDKLEAYVKSDESRVQELVTPMSDASTDRNDTTANIDDFDALIGKQVGQKNNKRSLMQSQTELAASELNFKSDYAVSSDECSNELNESSKRLRLTENMNEHSTKQFEENIDSAEPVTTLPENQKDQKNLCLPEITQPACDSNENLFDLAACTEQLPLSENNFELKPNDQPTIEVHNNFTIDASNSQQVAPVFELNELQSTTHFEENSVNELSNAVQRNNSNETAMDNMEDKIRAIEMQLGHIVDQLEARVSESDVISDESRVQELLTPMSDASSDDNENNAGDLNCQQLENGGNELVRHQIELAATEELNSTANDALHHYEGSSELNEFFANEQNDIQNNAVYSEQPSQPSKQFEENIDSSENKTDIQQSHDLSDNSVQQSIANAPENNQLSSHKLKKSGKQLNVPELTMSYAETVKLSGVDAETVAEMKRMQEYIPDVHGKLIDSSLGISPDHHSLQTHLDDQSNMILNAHFNDGNENQQMDLHEFNQISASNSSEQLSSDNTDNDINSEILTIDNDTVTFDDDAILNYIESRINVLQSQLGDVVDWFREYCTASRRTEQIECIQWATESLASWKSDENLPSDFEINNESFKEVHSEKSDETDLSNTDSITNVTEANQVTSLDAAQLRPNANEKINETIDLMTDNFVSHNDALPSSTELIENNCPDKVSTEANLNEFICTAERDTAEHIAASETADSKLSAAIEAQHDNMHHNVHNFSAKSLLDNTNADNFAEKDLSIESENNTPYCTSSEIALENVNKLAITDSTIEPALVELISKSNTASEHINENLPCPPKTASSSAIDDKSSNSTECVSIETNSTEPAHQLNDNTVNFDQLSAFDVKCSTTEDKMKRIESDCRDILSQLANHHQLSQVDTDNLKQLQSQLSADSELFQVNVNTSKSTELNLPNYLNRCEAVDNKLDNIDEQIVRMKNVLLSLELKPANKSDELSPIYREQYPEIHPPTATHTNKPVHLNIVQNETSTTSEVMSSDRSPFNVPPSDCLAPATSGIDSELNQQSTTDLDAIQPITSESAVHDYDTEPAMVASNSPVGTSVSIEEEETLIQGASVSKNELCAQESSALEETLDEQSSLAGTYAISDEQSDVSTGSDAITSHVPFIEIPFEELALNKPDEQPSVILPDSQKMEHSELIGTDYKEMLFDQTDGYQPHNQSEESLQDREKVPRSIGVDSANQAENELNKATESHSAAMPAFEGASNVSEPTDHSDTAHQFKTKTYSEAVKSTVNDQNQANFIGNLAKSMPLESDPSAELHQSVPSESTPVPTIGTAAIANSAGKSPSNATESLAALSKQNDSYTVNEKMLNANISSPLDSEHRSALSPEGKCTTVSKSSAQPADLECSPVIAPERLLEETSLETVNNAISNSNSLPNQDLGNNLAAKRHELTAVTDIDAVSVYPDSNVNLIGQVHSDTTSLEDDDPAVDYQLNDTADGSKSNSTAQAGQLSVGGIETAALSAASKTIAAIERFDIDSHVGGSQSTLLSAQTTTDDCQQLQQPNTQPTLMDRLAESSSHSPTPSEDDHHNHREHSSPNGFLGRLSRIARYSLPFYLLPLLLLLILLIYPHTENDFNCLVQFNEYRSTIQKTYQNGPPPV